MGFPPMPDQPETLRQAYDTARAEYEHLDAHARALRTEYEAVAKHARAARKCYEAAMEAYMAAVERSGSV